MVLALARRDHEDVRFCVRCGSHVYGTARPDSDHDFLLVLNDPAARRDLLWGKAVNVVVYGADGYTEALAEQSVFALEGLFAPQEHRLKEATPPFAYERDWRRLFAAAQGRSDADWSKAANRFEDEPEASRKRALHALRVLAFAEQIATHGRILDFEVAVPWWEELATGTYDSWSSIERAFAPKRQLLLESLSHPGGR